MGNNDEAPFYARLDKARERTTQFLLSGFTKEKTKPASLEQAWCPYQPNGGPSVEATCWAMMALGYDSDREDLRRISNGVGNFLASRQNKDGGWSTSPGAGKSDWNTAPAMISLRSMESPAQIQKLDEATKHAVKRSIQKGLDYLLDSRSEFWTPVARLLMLVSKGSQALDYSRGWPWDPHCFHWVEPTSYSLIALKLPNRPGAGVIKHVVAHANQFLLEHVCKGGGWNHGNDITLGANLPAYRLTTAEALVALQDIERNHKAIASGLEYLAAQEAKDSSSISLAWSIIARHAYDQDPRKELALLIDRQNEDGSFGVNSNLHVSAIALVALNTMAKEGYAALKLKDA